MKRVRITVCEPLDAFESGAKVIDVFEYDLDNKEESRTARCEIVDWLMKGKTLVSVPQF